jgi:hypothetical protein
VLSGWNRDGGLYLSGEGFWSIKTYWISIDCFGLLTFFQFYRLISESLAMTKACCSLLFCGWQVIANLLVWMLELDGWESYGFAYPKTVLLLGWRTSHVVESCVTNLAQSWTAEGILSGMLDGAHDCFT